MADSYAGVAEVYDLMIDWPGRLGRERPFFAEVMQSRHPRRVLDIGCATGDHARMFAEMGADVIGVDPSAAMLARARALTPGDNPRFLAGDLAHLPLSAASVELVTVLGNTLAHVGTARGLAAGLRAVARVLAPGGLLCIQGINYDSLLTAGERRLPVIARQSGGRDYLFLREYRLLRGTVEFTLVTLTHDGGWQQQVERSRHLPLTAAVLTRALARAGFAEITCYGSFTRDPYDPAASPNLVVLARLD